MEKKYERIFGGLGKWGDRDFDKEGDCEGVTYIIPYVMNGSPNCTHHFLVQYKTLDTHFFFTKLEIFLVKSLWSRINFYITIFLFRSSILFSKNIFFHFFSFSSFSPSTFVFLPQPHRRDDRFKTKRAWVKNLISWSGLERCKIKNIGIKITSGSQQDLEKKGTPRET